MPTYLSRSTVGVLSVLLTPVIRVLIAIGLLVTLSLAGVAGTFQVESRRELSLMKRKIRAAQFLQRATFGPTVEDIDRLAQRMQRIGVKRACSEWIDQQFGLPPSFHQPLVLKMIADDGYDTTQNLVWIQRFKWHAWWHHALTADDQLRQRVAWALSQILVTSENGAGFRDITAGDHSGIARWVGLVDYYDLMVKHVDGNYRDLLEEVTYHPIMGVYLSYLRNRKTDLAANRFPDENYAREIMQLFTIGLYDLRLDGRLKKDANGNLIPTHDNETIKEFAKVFTGLSYKSHPLATGNNRFWEGNDFQYPMEMFDFEHEPGTKTLLNGVIIGSESIVDGNADIQAALDNLMAHDNIAPFISRRLIQRLVKSNPSRGYIRRVARIFNNNGRGVKGDLKSVIKAVLLDPEVWHGQRVRGRRNPLQVEVIPRGTEHSKLAEPVIRYTRLLRGTHAKSDYHTGRMMVIPMFGYWTQEPYLAPSVFNFWLVDYQPPGDMISYRPGRRFPNGFLVAPEFQVKTAVVTNRLLNRYITDISTQQSRHYLHDSNVTMECNLKFQLDVELSLATKNTDMPRLMDYLDLVYCCGSMPQDYKDRCADVINQKTNQMRFDPMLRSRLEEYRVESALIAVLTSPFCAVTE